MTLCRSPGRWLLTRVQSDEVVHAITAIRRLGEQAGVGERVEQSLRVLPVIQRRRGQAGRKVSPGYLRDRPVSERDRGGQRLVGSVERGPDGQVAREG